MACRIPLFLLTGLFGFTSCSTAYNMSSIQVEILKPALFALPERIDTIAIFKRDYYQSDTIIYKYINGDNQKVTKDTSIHYSSLSNKCVDVLANSLEAEGYFLKVINYSDSVNYLFPKDSFINYPALHKRLGADALVFLDYLKFQDYYSESQDGFTFFMSKIKDKFPEFQKSTKVESIKADLLWTLTFASDTSIYICKQPEILYYGNSIYPALFGNDANHKLLLENTAECLGKNFVAKIIPSWEKVDRTYYRSNNDHLQVAEKYLIDGDWLKAAEIYKRETKSKNQNITAKSTYNLALICEMEGNLEAATDWLDRSMLAYKQDNPRHKFNCEQYITALATRKKEIERLEKQIRDNGEN